MKKSNMSKMKQSNMKRSWQMLYCTTALTVFNLRLVLCTGTSVTQTKPFYTAAKEASIY